jgi:hypothetical protein
MGTEQYLLVTIVLLEPVHVDVEAYVPSFFLIRISYYVTANPLVVGADQPMMTLVPS